MTDIMNGPQRMTIGRLSPDGQWRYNTYLESGEFGIPMWCAEVVTPGSAVEIAGPCTNLQTLHTQVALWDRETRQQLKEARR